MPTRTASAIWEGGLKTGNGKFEGESGAMAGPYTFGSRFEQARGSNPEELLAAAHAACYSMALSGELERSGKPPTRIETQARCTIERGSAGFRVTIMHLTVQAAVPGIEESAFLEAAEKAKLGCPISAALKGNVDVQLEAKLSTT